MALNRSKFSLLLFSWNMHFPLGMLKGFFTLNDIKIDLADRSKPKSKVRVSKNLFSSTILFEIFPER